MNDDDGNELLKSLKAHHLTLNGRGEAERKDWQSFGIPAKPYAMMHRTLKLKNSEERFVKNL